MIEQAVGRICRTRNKPLTTYILYDEGMAEFFMGDFPEKSHTKEFKALNSYIQSHTVVNADGKVSPEEVKRTNDALDAQRKLRRMRELALRYTPHPNQEDFVDEEDESDDGSIPSFIKQAQIRNQCYKQMIIRKPVVESLLDLGEQAILFWASVMEVGKDMRMERFAIILCLLRLSDWMS